MTWDDATILALRGGALIVFVLLWGVVIWWMFQPATRDLRRSRRTLLSLWWALAYVSAYALGQRIDPEGFAWLNQGTDWGPLSIAVFNALAAVLSAWAYLPWHRSKS